VTLIIVPIMYVLFDRFGAWLRVLSQRRPKVPGRRWTAAPVNGTVAPTNGDMIAANVSGPVEQVFLERSYHVATLDYDKAEIESRSVEFARKVFAS